MLKTIKGLQGVNILSKDAQKKIAGGDAPASGSGGCGVKVNGIWHPSGTNAQATQNYLGVAVNGFDATSWSPDGFVVYPMGGSYTGTVTNWCCDSCPWNQTTFV